MRAIHQFIPIVESGAVGTHCLLLRDSFRKAGFESEIFTDNITPLVAKEVHLYTDYGKIISANPEDILIYQMAVGSPVADFFKQQKAHLVVNHHNITPPSFFSDWQPDFIRGSSWGLQQLSELAKVSELAIADSSFNEQELIEVGYKKTAVVPVLINLELWNQDADLSLLNKLQKEKSAGGHNWLFVGRMVPHKAQHDIIKAFALYKKLFDPNSRLYLIGSNSSENYKRALIKLISSLELDSSVHFSTGVTHTELMAHYEAADIFVCLSDHEGFCVPLLEAMFYKIPILAFKSTAIIETLDNAGVIFTEKNYEKIGQNVE